jgi:hypothetical protein
VTGGNETAIGYKQSPPEVELTCYRTEPFNNSRSEDNARTRLEVEGVHYNWQVRLDYGSAAGWYWFILGFQVFLVNASSPLVVTCA